jgi:hypothetical protein
MIEMTPRIFAAAAILLNKTQTGKEMLNKAGLLPDAAGGYHVSPELVHAFIKSMSKRQLKMLREIAREIEAEDLGKLQ